MKKINDDPVRYLLVEKTQIRKGLFKKTVEAAAIGDENGKPLSDFSYVPDSIGTYEDGLIRVRSIENKFEFYLDLNGKLFLAGYDFEKTDNCYLLTKYNNLKGVAALDGTVLIYPRKKAAYANIWEDNNTVERFGSLFIYGWIETNPKLGPMYSQMGAAVLNGSEMKEIVPRSYNFVGYLGDNLVAAGRYASGGSRTEYHLLSESVTSTTYHPIFQVFSAETGELLSKMAFSGIEKNADGSYRVVVVPDIDSRELMEKGMGSTKDSFLSGGWLRDRKKREYETSVDFNASGR